MKKIYLTILILLAFVSIGFAQTNGLIMTSKVITWTDSLGFSGSDTLTVADSITVIPINYRAENFRIYLDGGAQATSVDSVKINFGARVYNSSGVCVDTTWGSGIGVKDSVGTVLATMVNSTTGKDYTLNSVYPVDLMKFSLMNYRAAKTTRNVRFTLQGWKE